MKVVTATTFRQSAEPNRNFMRFSAGALKSLAAAGPIPFLRDHAQRMVLARGGTVRSSVGRTVGGAFELEQRIELTAPWAIEAFEAGLIDRFSIGWHPTGPVRYAHDGKEIRGWPDHFPGEELDDGTIIEWEFTAVDLVEVSAVNVPAVVGTRVEGALELGRARLSRTGIDADAIAPLVVAGAMSETGLFVSAGLALARAPDVAAATRAPARIARGTSPIEVGVQRRLAEARATYQRWAAIAHSPSGGGWSSSELRRHRPPNPDDAKERAQAFPWAPPINPPAVPAHAQERSMLPMPKMQDSATWLEVGDKRWLTVQLSDRQLEMIASMGLSEQQWRESMARGGQPAQPAAMSSGRTGGVRQVG